MGRIGLINSGGESKAPRTWPRPYARGHHKRAAGIGLNLRTQGFQRPMGEGRQLLNAIQDVYLDGAITVA